MVLLVKPTPLVQRLGTRICSGRARFASVQPKDSLWVYELCNDYYVIRLTTDH